MLRASSGYPDTLETIKALGLEPLAFICFSVSGYPNEALAIVLIQYFILIFFPSPFFSISTGCLAHFIVFLSLVLLYLVFFPGKGEILLGKSRM